MSHLVTRIPKRGARVVGACDLGTYSGLILIAKSTSRGWIVLAEEQHTIDLLGDGTRGGNLPKSAILRAESLVRRFDHLAQEYQCDVADIVATSAVRRATNRAEIVKQLRQVTARRVTVLTPRCEGILSVQGALIGMPISVEPSIIVDIGGGSTEAIREASGGWQFRGVKYGASRATHDWRRLRTLDPKERFPRYKASAEEAMSDLPVWNQVPHRVIGVGGTIATLAALQARHKRLNPTLLHGRVITRRSLESTARRLSMMSSEQIAKLIPFDPKRARVITAGTFLWLAVCNRLDADKVVVSARGLRWGVAAQLSKMGRL